MRTIRLVSVTPENFRSFRKPTTIAFGRSPGFRFMTGRNLAEPALGANGAGKALADDLLIDTPKGRVRWGSLCVGDYVFGVNGLPTKIIGKYPQGVKSLYRVTFDDDASTFACAEHLWTVTGGTAASRTVVGRTITLSTQDLINQGISRKSDGACFWKIPQHSPVEFYANNHLPVDPYVLGMWLGNGTKSNGNITVNDRDTDVIAELSKIHYIQKSMASVLNRDPVKMHSGTGSVNVVIYGLKRLLQNMNLLDKSSNEISAPVSYLNSPSQIRLALLQGLMDSDGYCTNKGAGEFTSSSWKLASDVAWLCRSLGGKAIFKPAKDTHYWNEDGVVECLPSYGVSLRLDMPIFRAKRKASRQMPASQSRYLSRWIKSIEPTREEYECSCIRVEAENGLFLANDFIVTHNSTLWDALVWINFGTSIKDQRASDLTTWGQKKPRGQCVWDIDGELATVERSGNPNYLALNGQPVPQQSIDHILGRTKKQFVQTVIFGQGADTFIDLSIPERAGVLDDVLDLGLWLGLSDVAGKRISGVEKQIEEIARLIAYEDGRLASIPSTDELLAKSREWEDSRLSKMGVMIKDVEDAEIIMTDLIETSLRLEKRTSEHDDIAENKKVLEKVQWTLDKANESVGSVLAEISSTQKTLNFFTSHPDSCPTCNQRISAAFARDIVRDERKTMAELIDLNRRDSVLISELIKLRDANQAAISKSDRIREHLQFQIRETTTKIEHQGVLIHRMVKDVDRFGAETNPWSERIGQAHKDIDTIALRRSMLVTDKQKLEADTLLDGFWRDGFKRVRLFEINRILTHLELEIENACGMLGLFNWHIGVSTETETKTGGLRHGVQIQVTSPEASAPWESWSGGEGQRIRLAVAIGFASMIERMTATRFTLEVFDEPSSFLSPEGIDDFLACMRARVDAEHKSLWLIDCNLTINMGFDETYCMVKTAEGSHLELIASDE